MRSLVLVILSAVALAGMFMLYWTMQPASHRAAIESNAVVVVVPPQSAEDQRLNNLRGFHPGDVVWFKQYDEKQVLSTAFSARECVPQPDGTVHVTSPVAEFFLANNQRIELTGKDGNVVLKDPPDLRRTATMNPGPMSPPSRGRLNQVKIIFYDEMRPAGHQDVLTMVTNNVVFDNETFLIFTEGFRNESGEAIPNDQVPVDVTGEDLEFHGRGLTLRWNDKDGRLELLEVAHGEVMKIKHPGNFTPLGAPAKPPRRSGAAPVALLPGRPLPEMLAAKGKEAEQEIIRHHPQPATKPARVRDDRATHAPVVYLASFFDKVLVTQRAPGGASDQLQITSDRMDVNFLMKQSKEPATMGPTTAPASPATAPAPIAQATATPSATTQPTTQPATQPAEQPVFVRWSGILRITPMKTAPPVPLAPGDSAITLVGAPVTVHRVDPAQQNTEDVRCASVLYQTDGEKVLLGRSEQYPQILITDAPGPKAKEQRATRIDSTGTVEYSKVDQKVLLTGPGRAELPVEPTEKDKHPLLQAAWSRQALFDLTAPTTGDGQATVRDAHFAGNVDVRHPKLALRSQALDLFFDPRPKSAAKAPKPPGDKDFPPRQAQPDLRQVIASTDVFCAVEDSGGKKQNIQSQRLVLDTDLADDKLYPRHLNATGSVHAWGEDDLRAGYLDVVMKPSTKAKPDKPAKDQPPKSDGDLDTAQVEVENVLAKENVVARSKDGSIAEGQELRVTTPGGKQHVAITSPTAAKVTDAQGNIVIGPAIEADPDDGRAHVAGPGSIHIAGQKAQPVAQQAGAKPAPDDTKKPAPPTDVTWLGAADFDGQANRIDVTGSVTSRSIDKNGAVNTAVGEHMRIDLRPKPKPPATQPMVAAASLQAAPKTQRPTGPASSAKMDLFGNKEMVALTIEKGATMTSTLTDPKGGILQQLQLSGPMITVRELAPDGTPSRSLTVPAAGKMLVRDHRPPDKQATDDANGAGGARGATAFEWHKQLVYVESEHRADMTGQVRVVHQDEDSKQPPVEVNAETVTAIFEPTPQQTPKDPKKPAPKKDQTDQSAQLKFLIAKGPYVQVIRNGSQMIAQQIDYDPRHHKLIAIGNPRNPVVFDTGGSQQTTADYAEWDTINWNPYFRHPIVSYRPAAPATQPAKHVREASPEAPKTLKK